MARPRTGLSVRRRHPAAHRGRRADRSGRPATPSGTADSSNPHSIARAPRVRAWVVSVRRPRATPPLDWPASENLHLPGQPGLGMLSPLSECRPRPADDCDGREAADPVFCGVVAAPPQEEMTGVLWWAAFSD